MSEFSSGQNAAGSGAADPSVAASKGDHLPRVVFDASAVEVARALIGATLRLRGAGGVIVETEAYTPGDQASHSHCGPTRRNASMFGPPGHAYVYRSYGVHWCLNLVCARGHAVLLRAIEPRFGLERMQARRGARWGVRDLCSGPGRLAQALGVTAADDGARFDLPDFGIFPGPPPAGLLEGPRIGISRATDLPWRFGLAGSRFVSRPFAARNAGDPRASGPDSPRLRKR